MGLKRRLLCGNSIIAFWILRNNTFLASDWCSVVWLFTRFQLTPLGGRLLYFEVEFGKVEFGGCLKTHDRWFFCVYDAEDYCYCLAAF